MEFKNYRLNHAVDSKSAIGIKEQSLPPVIMGFFKRFFQKRSNDNHANKVEDEIDPMFAALKDQYDRDIEQDVTAIESILDADEEQPEELAAQPAPDYDENDASPDDVLSDDEMVSFSEKNVVEHDSIEAIGNHLESATIEGDVSKEVTFDGDE